jgi:hypothetical protein
MTPCTGEARILESGPLYSYRRHRNNSKPSIPLDILTKWRKPHGTIYIIPDSIEEWTVPVRLAKWHYIDLFKPDGFEKLVRVIRSNR